MAMKMQLKPVVTGRKPEPVSPKVRAAIRAHARKNRYNPDNDPALQEFKRRMRSVRVKIK